MDAPPVTTIYNLPPSPARWDWVGVFYIDFCVVWTLLVLFGMTFCWKNRNNPLLRLRGLLLSFSAIVLLHIYWILGQIVYIVGPTIPVVLAYDIQYFFMGIWFPLGIALFHASNSRLLHVAKLQKKYSSAGLRDQFNAVQPRNSWLWIGMFVQVILTVCMWLACRKYHPTYGIPGTEIKSQTLPEQIVELGRGWEWWPSVLWQVVWTWMVRTLRADTISPANFSFVRLHPFCFGGHGISAILWGGGHKRSAAASPVINSLHATPMFLIASYVPAFAPVNFYFPPSSWIHVSILLIEIFAVFVPAFQVIKQRILVKRIESLNIERYATSSTSTLRELDNLRRGSSVATRLGDKGGYESSDQEMKDTLLTISAFNYTLNSNPGPLQDFSALNDFSGENISFLTKVTRWKISWRAEPDEADVRDAYNAALDIYANFISPRDAEFPLNLGSADLKYMEKMFERAAREIFGQSNVHPAIPFETTTSLESAPASAMERPIYTGIIPAEFGPGIFDSIEQPIKYLVLTNTWPKFVKEMQSRRRSGETTRSGYSASSETSISLLIRYLNLLLPLLMMRKYMSKRQRPCDFCRSRKTACRIESSPPCRLCQQSGRECTFVEAARPRKRQQTAETSPGYHDANDGNSSSNEVIEEPITPLNHEDISPAESSTFPDINMDFLQDLDIDGPEYQFMFQTPDNNAPSTVAGSVDGSYRNTYPLLDGHENLHPETLGLSGDMDPYLLHRYQSDEHGTFKFKQLAIRSVNSNTPVQFLISQPSLFSQSRKEAGHTGASISSQRAELEKVISPNMGKRLISLCNRFIAPHYPIFSNDFPPDPATSAPCLLAAIYSIALPFAMYDDQLCIDMAYDSPDAEDIAHLINTAIAFDIHSPNIATVQTLFLLIARPSSNPLVSDASYRWTTMGMLVSAATNIGLHLDPSLWNIPAAQIAARRRLSFFIFAMDKWLAAALGRPPYINRENWLVDELSAQDENASGLDPSQWADVMDFSALTSSLASTLSRLYSLRSLSLGQRPEELQTTVFELSGPLERIKPDRTSLKDTNNDNSMPGMAIKLGYYYTQLLILRAAVHAQDTHPSASNTSDQWSPRESLKVVLGQYSDFLKNLTSDETAEHWPHWCQSAFSSLCFAILFMFVSATTYEEALSCMKQLQSTRRQMRLKANAFVVMRLGLLRMDAIFWRGVDQVLRLEPHVKLALDASKQGT
ncbi:transcriptional regulatory [Fusarium mundagurra]|uniref:Transcriptional regulatory n=1 Tax=Fusarium mundagurra TaxID=1567541 RepID=A0A8H5Z5X0_9HYPO|nr:transcriptional regulatory [Fusarium mundagurra]